MLIANADDFGQSQAINEGIRLAHVKGLISAASLMINMPFAREAHKISLALPRLGVGLHVNLTYGKPVEKTKDISSLVDNEGFFIRPIQLTTNPTERYIRNQIKIILKNFEKEADPLQVEREIRAQFTDFQRLFKSPPLHLDSHHHLHRIPMVLEIFSKIAKENDIAIRSVDAEMHDTLRRRGIKTCDRFVDRFWGMLGPKRMTERVRSAVTGVEPGVTEILFHPAKNEIGRKHPNNLLYEQPRSVELDVLCETSLRKLVVKSGIRLVNYGDI